MHVNIEIMNERNCCKETCIIVKKHDNTIKMFLISESYVLEKRSIKCATKKSVVWMARSRGK